MSEAVHGPWPWGLDQDLRARLMLDRTAQSGYRVEVLTGPTGWTLASGGIAFELMADELARINKLLASQDPPEALRTTLRSEQWDGAIAAYRWLRKQILALPDQGSLEAGGLTGETEP